MGKVAYIHKVSGGRDRTGGYTLTICDRPCSGEEFHSSEKMNVISKDDARRICAVLGVKPYNF